jgi:hypothetical protein
MQNFHIKSIILGIGTGIIITTVIFMIYLAGSMPTMSKDEIIAKATQYGMVEKNSIIKDTQSQTTQSTSANESIIVDSTGLQQDNVTQGTTQADISTTDGQEVNITVDKGDSSENVAQKLMEAGLINDKTAFINELTDMGLESQINIGQFKIKTGAGQKEIITILTEGN